MTLLPMEAGSSLRWARNTMGRPFAFERGVPEFGHAQPHLFRQQLVVLVVSLEVLRQLRLVLKMGMRL